MSRKKDHRHLVFLSKVKRKRSRCSQRGLNMYPLSLRYLNNYKKAHNRSKDMATRKRNRSAAIGVRVIKIL